MKLGGGIKNLMAASQMSYLAFIVSGVRNIWLAKVLLPEDLAGNSLSSLLIALGLFMDFGAVYSIRRFIPIERAAGKDSTATLLSIKGSMASALSAFGGLLCLVGCVLLLLGKPELSIGFFAGGAILPIQALSNFRNATYVAFGKNTRGATMMLTSVVTNFAATLLLLPLLGKFVIIATPIIGYAVALFIDTKIPGSLLLPRINLIAGAKEFKTLGLKNRSLAINQVLAFSLVTIEAWISYFFLDLKDAASLGLIANLTAAISVFPITFSNQIQSQIVIDKSGNNSRLHGLLRSSRLFLLESLSFITLSGAVAMTLLIQYFLPAYQYAVLPLWVMALSTFFYGSTFYTSNYAIGMGVEKKVSKVQLLLTLFVLALSMSLASAGALTLLSLCFVCLIKSLLYVYLASQAIYRSSSRTLVRPLAQIITTLLRSIPLLICAVGYFTSLNLLVLLGVVAEAIILSFRIAPTWKAVSQNIKTMS